MTNFIKGLLITSIGVTIGIVTYGYLKQSENDMEESESDFEEVEIEDYLDEETMESINNIKTELRRRIIFNTVVKILIFNVIPFMILMNNTNRRNRINPSIIIFDETFVCG